MPIFAALLWGLSYSIYGQVLKTISVPTLMVYVALANIGSALAFSAITGNKISLTSPFVNPELGLLLILVIISGASAWLIMLNVVKFVSPTYAAFGEVAYPLFVPIFSYLIFRRNEFDWGTILGGLLVMIGLFIMVYFKGKTS